MAPGELERPEVEPPSSSGHTYTFLRGVSISGWLSQNTLFKPYAGAWFSDEDLAWIAAQGFDHVRYPIDGRRWVRPDGSLDEAAMAPFDRALRQSRRRGLGVILDMHSLPGAGVDLRPLENTVFTDLEQQQAVATLWRRVAARYASEGPWLRLEILNEPVAQSPDLLNAFQRNMLAAIRLSSPERVVYLTSNRWSAFDTVPEVEVPNDVNVAFTFHFYKPMAFTHQQMRWAGFPGGMPAVPFPGKVPDLTGYLGKDHYAWLAPGSELTIAQHIDVPFASLAAWARTKAPGHEVHIGEFGVTDRADPGSRRNYIAAVREACERQQFGWAVWSYTGRFAVRDPDGRPTDVLRGLFPQAPAKSTAGSLP